jgi:hydrogenase maturation protein HypF
MHPDYASTRYARELQIADCRLQIPEHIQSAVCNLQSTIAVQHHHAHLAACLAEHGVDEPALGVTWDGAGYGADGTIWGGEFLLGDAAGFERVAHLRPFRLPGGDAAIKEPGRIALALLADVVGSAVLAQDDLPPVHAYPPAERQILAHMLHSGLNAPLTSSVGRLFDGVAALIGLRQHVSFEGQAAMSLEWIVDTTVLDAYPIDLAPHTRPDEAAILDWRPLIAAVLGDLRRGVERGVIAARFHNALVAAIVTVATDVGAPRVALTGGCFLNRLLVERVSQRLTTCGFEVLIHRQVPPGDGGISLGQLAVAAARLRLT